MGGRGQQASGGRCGVWGVKEAEEGRRGGGWVCLGRKGRYSLTMIHRPQTPSSPLRSDLLCNHNESGLLLWECRQLINVPLAIKKQ